MRLTQNKIGYDTSLEKYSRGRRGAPAKGVGRSRGARVRIPLSPLALLKIMSHKIKKVLTKTSQSDNIYKLSLINMKRQAKKEP